MINLTPRLWLWIANGAIFLALIVALLATRATLSETKLERDSARTSLSVSNGSIKRLEDELARMLVEQQELSQSDAQRMQASREMLAIAEAASKARQAVIARLQQSAAATEAQPAHETTCTFSDAVNAAWPGD